METKGLNNDRDTLIDLESGNSVVISEHNHGVDANFQHMDCCPPSTEAAAKNGDDRKSEGEEKMGLLDNFGGEKAKKKRSKKPPRPPRPPTPTPLDASDQKLLNELSELAVLKRARIERMKALKKMKSAKQGPSSSNLFPMIITIIFCLVILWQGFFSRQGSDVSFHGSPESSVRAHSSLISIRFHKRNHSNTRPHSSTSAAPKYVSSVSRSKKQQEILFRTKIWSSLIQSVFHQILSFYYSFVGMHVTIITLGLLLTSLVSSTFAAMQRQRRGWRSMAKGGRL